jgi:hypothetical protein
VGTQAWRRRMKTWAGICICPRWLAFSVRSVCKSVSARCRLSILPAVLGRDTVICPYQALTLAVVFSHQHFPLSLSFFFLVLGLVLARQALFHWAKSPTSVTLDVTLVSVLLPPSFIEFCLTSAHVLMNTCIFCLQFLITNVGIANFHFWLIQLPALIKLIHVQSTRSYTCTVILY